MHADADVNWVVNRPPHTAFAARPRAGMDQARHLRRTEAADNPLQSPLPPTHPAWSAPPWLPHTSAAACAPPWRCGRGRAPAGRMECPEMMGRTGWAGWKHSGKDSYCAWEQAGLAGLAGSSSSSDRGDGSSSGVQQRQQQRQQEAAAAGSAAAVCSMGIPAYR